MNSVIFLTTTYPYGSGEEFIESEIGVLARKFDRVIVIATEVKPEVQTKRDLPENAISLRFNTENSKISKLKSALRMMQLFICRNEVCKVEISRNKRLSDVKFILRTEEQCMRIWRAIRTSGTLKILEKDNVTIYSYWLYKTARIGTLIMKHSNLQVNHMISRAHRYDLYEDMSPVGFLPYRSLFLSEYDLIAPCSKDGAEHLIKRGNGKAKIEVSYLGTRDYGIGNVDMSPVLHIVSCSNLVPVKRVNRIASALNLLDTSCQVRWTHIGSGSLLTSLKSMIDTLPSNINVILLGALSNEEVMKFYQREAVDAFVNVSSSEGLPVSIMEASSFGIPSIATNVGGTSEIIQEGINGYLLKDDFTDEELACAIGKIAKLKRADKIYEFRKLAREIWQENFVAEDNYERFWKRQI